MSEQADAVVIQRAVDHADGRAGTRRDGPIGLDEDAVTDLNGTVEDKQTVKE